MCWQGFVRFRCGHTQLIEEECQHARDLDLPFWLKVDCPHYRISHRDPRMECGTGHFYCAETADGQYLQMVVKQRAESEQRLTQLDAALTNKLNPWEDSVVQQLKARYSNQFQAMQAYNAHPQIAKINSVRQGIEHERQNVLAKFQDADSTLYYSDQFFKLNAHHAGGGVRPPLPGYLRQYGKVRHLAQPRRPPHNGWLGPPYHGQANVAGPSHILPQKTNNQTIQKPRAVAKHTPPVEAPVRRSARGKKQVNYAEDDESTESSPAPSPVAPQSSLKDIILEQRQRDAARTQPSNKPGNLSFQDIILAQRQHDAARKEAMNEFSTRASVVPRAATPETANAPSGVTDSGLTQKQYHDKLRESFAKQVKLQPTILTPPVTRDLTDYTTRSTPSAVTGSPLKRKISSSPAVPPNKRLQFNFPSAAPVSASSPPPRRIKYERAGSAAWFDENTRPSSAPAPGAQKAAQSASPQLGTLRGSNGMEQAWDQQQQDATSTSAALGLLDDGFDFNMFAPDFSTFR
ncbi:hypothetical protein CLAFUW4_08031 [Fulvia fulva]|uniref:Uncharacterized protein n=1 Tax=Passalora fulva TaxID=5499 RepID=A0A9Q8LDW5_PASFU|nr:uncharacterized protein CLAFUR5_08149 [Fulvia fulva]KAK4629247.1 hypothetical protein CLAFUR4_08036 [Fulvia fulva]KAK4630537.1 hypothetical protein CLAFUR0_08031 [Fulvia fulva]UJO15429.1 hypothetical protein CLAFUR5_08149 [Fulvia fulva]WPV12934.1 hypothetical protein CLAFUW4_08031 [Fulvia fulva]WPV27065.1 hypothetical protein CLAFUW7_08031 [Fulvia fulva]